MRIENTKDIFFHKYLDTALKNVCSLGYSYTKFPETDYCGYIFFSPKDEEIKIPMQEFINIFESIPNRCSGWMREDTLTILPEFVLGDIYEKEFAKSLLKVLDATKTRI